MTQFENDSMAQWRNNSMAQLLNCWGAWWRNGSIDNETNSTGASLTVPGEVKHLVLLKIFRMKKLAVFILSCIWFTAGYSQPDETAGSINNVLQIPSFSIIVAPDSSVFTREQLQKDQPVVLMFFNPDCDHCQQEVKELLAHKNELTALQIVMVSALPYKLIKTFYDDHSIQSMPNVTMGQDANFALGSLYKPARYPSLYIYDATGSLAKVFAGNAGVAAILDAVK